MTSFHLILPSNSSMKTFPDNKVNHYVNALSKRIELDGDLEVALFEIMFAHSWFNVQPEECLLYLKTPFSSTWKDFTIKA